MFHPADIPDTIKRPGYPALIHLFGHSILITVLFQSLLSALKVPLVFMLGRSLGLKATFALLAAALMAIEPVDVLLCAELLTEAVFGFLLLAGTVLLFRKEWPCIIGAALVFGLAAWVRPNGLTMALVAGAGAFCFLRLGVARTAVFVTVGLLTVLPWPLHNQRVLGRFYLGDSGVVAAGYYQVPQVLQAVGDPRADRWQQTLNDRASSTNWEDDGAYHAFFDDLRAEVRTTLLTHPFTWLRLQAEKAARITVAPGRGHIALFFAKGSAVGWSLMVVSAGFSIGLLLALLVSLVWWRAVPRTMWPLLIMAGALIVMGALTTSDARFKNPGMALLIVVGAWAVQSTVERWASPREAQ